MQIIKHWRLTKKMAAIFLVTGGLGGSGLVAIQAVEIKAVLYDFAAANEYTTVGLLATNIYGAVRWRKADRIAMAYQELIDDPNSPIAAISVFDIDKNILHEYVDKTNQDMALSNYLQTDGVSLFAEKPQQKVLAHHVVVVAPVVGESAAAVGYLAVAYSRTNLDKQVSAWLFKQWGISLLVLSAIGGFLWAALRSLALKPLAHLIGLTRELAEGDRDLRRRLQVAGNDEIAELAQWINVFVDRIHLLVKDVSMLMSCFKETVTQTVQQAELSRDCIEKQKQDTMKLTNATAEITLSVKAVAGSAEHAADAANQVQNAASQGSNIVHESQSQIEALAKQVKASAASLEDLSEKASSIGKVLEVIIGIAEQTRACPHFILMEISVQAR